MVATHRMKYSVGGKRWERMLSIYRFAKIRIWFSLPTGPTLCPFPPTLSWLFEHLGMWLDYCATNVWDMVATEVNAQGSRPNLDTGQRGTLVSLLEDHRPLLYPWGHWGRSPHPWVVLGNPCFGRVEDIPTRLFPALGCCGSVEIPGLCLLLLPPIWSGFWLLAWHSETCMT